MRRSKEPGRIKSVIQTCLWLRQHVVTLTDLVFRMVTCVSFTLALRIRPRMFSSISQKRKSSMQGQYLSPYSEIWPKQMLRSTPTHFTSFGVFTSISEWSLQVIGQLYTDRISSI